MIASNRWINEFYELFLTNTWQIFDLWKKLSKDQMEGIFEEVIGTLRRNEKLIKIETPDSTLALK